MWLTGIAMIMGDKACNRSMTIMLSQATIIGQPRDLLFFLRSEYMVPLTSEEWEVIRNMSCLWLGPRIWAGGLTYCIALSNVSEIKPFICCTHRIIHVKKKLWRRIWINVGWRERFTTIMTAQGIDSLLCSAANRFTQAWTMRCCFFYFQSPWNEGPKDTIYSNQ